MREVSTVFLRFPPVRPSKPLDDPTSRRIVYSNAPGDHSPWEPLSLQFSGSVDTGEISPMMLRANQMEDLWSWADREGNNEVRFLGLGTSDSARDALARLEPAPPAVAWVTQTHSATVLPVETAGNAGCGDALATSRTDLALSIATADCVPVLIGQTQQVAAIHAGWRGIVSEIVPAGLACLDTPLDKTTVWLGPAIGPCCYEVGSEVAEQVVTASEDSVARPGPEGKFHLDLQSAIICQLRTAGIHRVRRVTDCTRCHPDRLWSYRRLGKGAGRNYAFIWRRGADTD